MRNAFLIKVPLNMPGLFYRYTNFRKQFWPPQNHFPRHRVFSQLALDPQLKEYILRDTNMYFFADSAIPASSEVFAEILQGRFDRQVVMVEGLLGEETARITHLPEKADPSSRNFLLAQSPLPLELAEISVKGEKAFYSFLLPKDFPDSLSTGILSLDQLLLQVYRDKKPLEAVQGQLVRPLTFDLQNIQSRRLIVALALEDIPKERGFVFYYPPRGSVNLGKIWRNQPDNLGFDYTAPKDGWLVLHFPYDKKWTAALDGRATPIYQANKIFMGIPLKAGEHKILLRYWPNTWLRPLMGLSIVLFAGGIFAVIGMGLRQESLRRES
jgi:hypothetical protein